MTVRVDFGGGNDRFTNSFGAFTFNASFLNGHVCSRFCTLADDLWNMQQALDTGDVIFDFSDGTVANKALFFGT